MKSLDFTNITIEIEIKPIPIIPITKTNEAYIVMNDIFKK